LSDFSKEVAERIPEYVALAKKNPESFQSAMDSLMALEKKTRLGGDAKSTAEVCVAILQVCFDTNRWDSLQESIQSLCKKRAQLQRPIQSVVTEGMKFLERAPTKQMKLDLLKTLRTVAEGKIFVELETARMTRMLAEMKEAEGNATEAAEILQEVQVETIGAMEVREKAAFLLEQFRLCMNKQDWVRTEIIAKKISAKSLNKDELQDLKLRYYDLMIQFHLHSGHYFDTCRAYEEIFRTKIVENDPVRSKEALKKTVLFLALSPFDSEVSDMLQRLMREKALLQLPVPKLLLENLTTEELMAWPLKDEAEWKSDDTFNGNKGPERWADFHKRIVQHNILVIASYYTRISTPRFAQLLMLDEDKSERHLAEMVTSKQTYARIDRPAGIITFARKQTANETVEKWSNDISSLLALVDETCHLINKEYMLQAASNAAASAAAAANGPVDMVT